MKLIVGLGNKGKEYHATRHNLGFAVVDVLAITFGRAGGFKKHPKAAAEVLDLKASHSCILVKPTTMMNLSGQAAGELLRYYKVDPADVWVVYDDLDLPFGQMRVRTGGSSGGHNGVKSLIQHIGEDFWRVRLGIQNQFLATTPTDKFVLDPFMPEEAVKVPGIVESAANEIESGLLKGGLVDHTVNLI